MTQSELPRRARPISLWTVAYLVVGTAMAVSGGMIAGWALAIEFEGMLLLLLVPSLVLPRCVGHPTVAQRGLAVLGGMVLACAWVWLLTYPLGAWFGTFGWGNRPFDSVAWKAAPKLQGDPDGEHNPRGAMLRSLLQTQHLRCKTRAEVVALLGPPEPASGVPQRTAAGLETWDYYVGWYSGFHMDQDFVSVIFDHDGRVTGWAIWQS